MTMHRWSTIAARSAACLATAVCLFAAPAALAQVSYRLTELLIGPKSEITLYSAGRGINKTGQTTIEYGYSFSGFAAARCDKALCTRIPSIGESFLATSPAGINDVGLVTGSSFSGFTTHAFLFDGVRTIDLGGLPDDGCGGCRLDSVGRDVNNLGDVVGLAFTLSGEGRAFVYRHAAMTALGTLGGNFSDARAINDQGDIVGVSALANGSQHAFAIGEARMMDLGTLGGTYSAAFDVNEMRQIAGCSTIDGDIEQRAFVFQQGVMTALPSLGGKAACAYGINRFGRAVGYASTPDESQTRATLWIGMQVIDLNALIDAQAAKHWTLIEATAINDRGQIIVTGLHGGVSRAALLTPMASP
jgi:probable HAF family extracellular repeat protein